MNKETIKFNFEFFPEYTDDDYPSANILIDSESKFDGIITDSRHVVSFWHTLSLDQQHRLTINRYGKANKPQQLTIKRISIDGIDIRNIIWAHSYNTPIYPEPWASQQRAAGIKLEEQVLGETCFGHNGTWVLNFTSPFYKFLYDWMDGYLE